MVLTDEKMRSACRSFWQERNLQASRASGGIGTNKETSGGKHLHSLLGSLEEMLRYIGWSEVMLEKKLPGYFSPSKNWDVVALGEKEMVLIEARSQAGVSIGNNYNNRIQEMVGSAFEIRQAQAHGALQGWKIFLGAFFILEDCSQTMEGGRIKKTGRAWAAEPEPRWLDLSYAERYRESLETLVGPEGLLQGAGLLLTKKGSEAYSEPSALLSAAAFEQKLRSWTAAL